MNSVLSGLIPAPELECALDNLEDEENTLCLMSTDPSAVVYESEDDNMYRMDFMRYIDEVGISLPLKREANVCRRLSPWTSIPL